MQNMPGILGHRRVASRFLAGSALGLVFGVPAVAGQAPPATGTQQPEQVIIQGQRPEDYKVNVPALTKLTEPLVDTPQSINILPEQLLKDRAATNLNDALRSVPGISLGAGEFMWQGNNPSIRGFVARTDMFLDGMRDFGSYYRDDFNFDQIEVLEGPSSILFGRGSTGGVINQVSKLPTLDPFVLGSVMGGTDYTRRATVDIDERLDDLGPGAAFRLTAMGHESKVAGRDVGEYRRYGFAPSLALGIGTPMRLTVGYFHQTENDIPDYGLPWYFGNPAPVPRHNFYGFKTDFLHTDADIGTARAGYDFSDAVMVRDQLRYAEYRRDFFTSQAELPSSVLPTTPLSAVMVNLNEYSGFSRETMLQNQTDLTARFSTGPITHSIVTGVEIGRETSAPTFNNSVGVPQKNLLDPNPDELFTATSTFPREKTDARATSLGLYAIDTLKLSEQWELTAGIRWDRFDLHFRSDAYSAPPAPVGVVTSTTNIHRLDEMPSYRGALVYKPLANGSIYFDYGTSFNPSAESLTLVSTAHTNSGAFPVANAFLAPEKNQTFELGSKWNLMNGQLSLTGAIFRLEKQNARVPDPNNLGFNILEGTQRVDGFDIQLIGRITENWQLTAGYAYLDSHVVKSAPGAAPVGSPLTNAPKNAFTFFSEYKLGGGFEVGGGGQYVSSRLAKNTAPILKAPGYWTFDAMVKYDLSAKMSLQLNVSNIFDKYYYDQLHPFHVVPGPGRTALLSLNFTY